MNPPRLVRLVLSIAVAALAVTAAAAQAAGVAYLKDRQVWVSSLDGTRKVQLSSGDAWWNAVGQSASGGIVATKNEPGKIFQLSQFAIWNPDGSVKDAGPASPGLNFSGSLAFPLGLELTAANTGLVYGFSHYVYGYPVGTLTQGYAILPSSTRTSPSATYTNTAVRWPTLAGGRVIGTPDASSQIAVESAAGNLTGPFTTWAALALNIPGAEIHRVQSSADGQILAVEVADGDSAHPTRILVMKTAGLLGAYVDDCWLPVSGEATSVDVSADGSLLAYTDAGGLKVVATPNLRSGGPSDCELASGPVTVDAAGGDPALGPIDVDALSTARNPAPPTTPIAPTAPTTGPPTPTAPGGGSTATPGGGAATPAPSPAVPGLTRGAVTAGGTVRVTARKAGRVTVTVTVAARAVGRRGKAIVVATGSIRATRKGVVKVRLKPTRLGRALKAKLRGRKVKVVIRSGGRTTTKTVTLK